MHFKNKEELMAAGQVSHLDKVHITWRGKNYNLTVNQNYIHIGPVHDSKIIEEMAASQGHSLTHMMNKIYGYSPDGGDWPSYKHEDYKAAYRALLWITHTCEYEQIETTYAGLDSKPNPYTTGNIVTEYGYEGIVMKTDKDWVHVAWSSGEIGVHKHFHLSPVQIKKEDISKTKQIHNEHLQKQDLPGQGGKRTTSNSGSGGRFEHSVGCGHRGYEAYFEDSHPKIRSNKISGTPVKF